jgi:TonB family protein
MVSLLSCITASAQQPEMDRAGALRSLLSEMVVAVRNGADKQIEEMSEDLIVPEPQSFFSQVFGVEEGAKLAANYSGQKEHLKERIVGTLREMAKADPSKLEISTVKHDSPDGPGLNDFWRAVLQQRRTPVPLFSASYRVGRGSWHALAQFFQIDGRFGIVDNQTFTGLSGVPPLRLRVGGNVMVEKLLNQVNPRYPEAAKQGRIQGTVRLSVVVGTDGAIKELEVVSGPKDLIEVSVEAVKQWRYRVTKLNGVPVEVLTTIDIVFTLFR